MKVIPLINKSNATLKPVYVLNTSYLHYAAMSMGLQEKNLAILKAQRGGKNKTKSQSSKAFKRAIPSNSVKYIYFLCIQEYKIN